MTRAGASAAGGGPRAWLNRGIGALVPWVALGSMRSQLAGVWGRLEAPLPDGGVVVAANHHSWWDGYLALLLARRLRRPLALVMTERQLRRFPFFRAQGAIGTGEVRTALRRLAGGAMLVIFPEGALRRAGAPGELRPGATYLARRSGCPLVPVAVRVALRGGQRPEAYLLVGAPMSAAGSASEPSLATTLTDLVARLDGALADADPERPAPDFACWLRGAASTDRRAAWGVRWWGDRGAERG